MGVFKEEAYAFETISKKSKRIYNDSADFGFPYNTQDPPAEVISVIDAINSMKESDAQYPEEKNLVRNRETWGDKKSGGVSVDVVIFWEREDGYDIGTKYHISFNKSGNSSSKIQKEFDAFLSVDVEPYSERS
jgi:hypothetical protein